MAVTDIDNQLRAACLLCRHIVNVHAVRLRHDQHVCRPIVQRGPQHPGGNLGAIAVAGHLWTEGVEERNGWFRGLGPCRHNRLDQSLAVCTDLNVGGRAIDILKLLRLCRHGGVAVKQFPVHHDFVHGIVPWLRSVSGHTELAIFQAGVEAVQGELTKAHAVKEGQGSKAGGRAACNQGRAMWRDRLALTHVEMPQEHMLPG